MSERANVTKVEFTPKPYLKLSTREQLDAAVCADSTQPLVILGETALGEYTMAESATALRKRGVNNPIIFYTPNRIVSSVEKAEFLNAGGDTVIDKSDLGTKEEDPGQDAILLRMAFILKNAAQDRKESRNRTILTPDIQLDSHSRLFYISGVRVPLTGFQTELMEAFFRLRALSKEGAVTTEKFVMELYGKDTVETRDRLRAMISSQINKKLHPFGFELNASSKKGYSFVPARAE